MPSRGGAPSRPDRVWRPDPGVVEKVPSWWKYRSPSSPLPGTARTSLTETMRPAADGVMWMESTVPLNILEASLSLQVAQPDAFLGGWASNILVPRGRRTETTPGAESRPGPRFDRDRLS